MLHVKLICVGKLRERFYADAFQEYSKRLGAFCRFDCAELSETRLPDAPSERELAAALDKEAEAIRKAIPPGAYVISLCVEGQSLSSEALARLIARREGSGKPRLCLIIGGSYGLAPSVKAQSDLRLSMSAMTFPHHLARVMLAEQLYRAFQINEGSRYHK